jgi:uncharacterized protein
MQRNLQKKVIVITGGSSGIGAEIAAESARKGALPVLIARSEDKMHAVSQRIKMETGILPLVFKGDVTDTDRVKEIFDTVEAEAGKVDVLVNNAGFGIFDYVTDIDMKDAEEMFRVNVLGTIACTKAAVPRMNAGSHILFVSSLAGKVATPKSSVYSATKHAVNGFANACRMELRNSGIYVSTINPGPVETGFFHIADKEGTYRNNVASMMMEASKVAEKTVRIFFRRRRELNLPWWMGTAAKMYQLAPSLLERIAGSRLSKK